MKTSFVILILAVLAVTSCNGSATGGSGVIPIPAPTEPDTSADISSIQKYVAAKQAAFIEAMTKPHTPGPVITRADQIASLAAYQSAALKPAPVAGAFGAAPSTIYPKSWSVTDWYTDDQDFTGLASDNNDCQTPTTPCLTFNEIPVHRWGTSTPTLGGASSQTFVATIHALSAWSDSTADAINVVPAGGALDIVGPLGAVNQVATGMLASVIGKNPTSDQVLTVTLGAGLSPGKLLHNTTHDSYAWTNSNPSGNVWLISQPVTLNGIEVDNWTNGDTFFAYTPINMVVDLLGSPASTLTSFVSVGANAHPGHGLINSGFTHSQVTANLSSAEVAFGLTFADCDIPQTFLFSSGGISGLVINAGQYRGSNNMQGNFQISNDFLSTGLNLIPRMYSTLNRVWIQNIGGVTGAMIVPDAISVNGYIAGNSTITLIGNAALTYTSTATLTFLNATAPAGQFRFGINTATVNGCAVDLTVDPALWHCGRAVTSVNLDATIASGGFAGNAYNLRAGSIVKE